MMNFIKNFISIIFIVSLLTSCSTNTSKKTVIKYSSWGSESEISILKPIIKEFEAQNDDIDIEFIHIPKNYFQKLHLLIASNLAPDVIFLNNLNGPVYAKNDILENLNDYLKKDTLISEKVFFKKSLEALTFNNELYAIPRDVSNLVVYYNKDLFDKYRIPYPQTSWTFTDFKNTAQLLTRDFNNDGKIDQFGTSFEETPLFWMPFLWSNGGGILNTDLNKVIISKEESINSLQFYANLRNRWHVAPSASEQGSATMAQMFMHNKVAMFISGRWSVPRFRKEIEFDWDIVNFPNGKAGSIVDSDASGWAISKTCKNKQMAWRFIKFLSSNKSSTKFTRSGLIIPARIDIANSEIFLNKNEKPYNSKVFIEALPQAIPTPANENYQELIDIINNKLEPLWRNKKTAKEVVDDDLIQKLKKLL